MSACYYFHYPVPFMYNTKSLTKLSLHGLLAGSFYIRFGVFRAICKMTFDPRRSAWGKIAESHAQSLNSHLLFSQVFF